MLEDDEDDIFDLEAEKKSQSNQSKRLEKVLNEISMLLKKDSGEDKKVCDAINDIQKRFLEKLQTINLDVSKDKKTEIDISGIRAELAKFAKEIKQSNESVIEELKKREKPTKLKVVYSPSGIIDAVEVVYK